MPDESTTPTKSTATDFKDKSPQAIVASTLVLLADLVPDEKHAKILRILAPLIALVVVLSVTKLTELGVFLFKHYTSRQPEADKPLDIRLKTYIRESERKLFWMWKSNPDYPELLEHTKQLKRRLRSYELGRLKLNISAPTPPSAPSEKESPSV